MTALDAVDGSHQAIEAAGAELRFLPPYSPDFNPIEMAFSILKAVLKKPPLEPSMIFGMQLPKASKPSPRPNVKTTLPPQDMTWIKSNLR